MTIKNTTTGGSFTLEGASEIQKVLKQLPGKIEEKVRLKALRKGAKVIADEAKRKAPDYMKARIVVRKATKKQRSLKDLGEIVVTVKLDRLPAPHWVEFGTGPRVQKSTGRETGQMPAEPFMRPAFDTKNREALKVIGQTLGPEVEKAAQKLAGSFAKSGLSKNRRGGRVRLF